jgi:hypothetical protein
MPDTERLLEETATALMEIGETRAQVQSAIVAVAPGSAQYDGLACWRERLEDLHLGLVLACGRWRLGTGSAADVRWYLDRWREDPTRCAL